jgi:hypothetical protein
MNAMTNISAPGNLLVRSTLYQEFLAERAAILRHKWLESEKAGHDIGFENALVSWVVHHRAGWRRERRQQLAETSALAEHGIGFGLGG